MGNGFLKFKRKANIVAFIKSLIIGVSLGLIVFSALLLLHKREVVVFKPAYSALVGVGVAIVAFVACYVLFKPRDKRIAKRLDEELALQERVQTMLAFQESDDEMQCLQRRDADERLSAMHTSALRFGKLWRLIAMGLLSLAMLITSLCVPAIEPPKPQDPNFDLNDWQRVSLQNLIEYVEDSDMQQSPKEYTLNKLNGLLVALDEVEKESVMKSHVVKVIVDVDDKVDKVNSCTTIRTKLGETADIDVIKLANNLRKLQNSASVEGLSDLRTVFAYDTYVQTVDSFNKNVQSALKDSGYDQTDALYLAIDEWIADLQTEADAYSSHTAQSLESALHGENGIGGIFTRFADKAHAALVQQKTNRRVADYVQTELMNIFKLTDEDLPDLNNDDEEEFQGSQDDDDEEKGPAPGSPDDGETNYGSNDLIFDPERGFVHYGEVLTDYENIMDEWLQDDNVPEELKQMIRDYFNSL